MNRKSDFGYYPYPTLNYEYDVGRERERNAMAFKKWVGIKVWYYKCSKFSHSKFEFGTGWPTSNCTVWIGKYDNAKVQ